MQRFGATNEVRAREIGAEVARLTPDQRRRRQTSGYGRCRYTTCRPSHILGGDRKSISRMAATRTRRRSKGSWPSQGLQLCRNVKRATLALSRPLARPPPARWAFGAGAAAAADCGSLAGKTFGDATITAATNVVAALQRRRQGSAGAGRRSTLRSAASRARSSPPPNSDIAFEVWLPPAEAWNGKYEGVGNGGFAGSLIYSPMAWALEARLCGVGNRHRPFRRIAGRGLGPRPSRKDRRLRLAGASTRPPPRPRRSSRPITRRRRPMPISPAARTAAGKR